MLPKGYILKDTYQIEEQIGKGGGGIVYRATHLRLNKQVVVKKIRDKVMDVIDIRREADILKGLSHTYLPQVYDYLEIDGQVFTILDYIPGKTIEYYIKKGYHFNQKQVIQWMKQLCEALEYLHTQTPSIIHSDVKPANIIVTPQGNICLIDFNISLAQDKKDIISGISYGYASPEMYWKKINRYENRQEDHVVLDARTDIYSLGATVYHMLTLQKPPKEYEKIVPLEQYELNYSEAFIAIVSKAMDVNLTGRYQSAREMLYDLENIHKMDQRLKKQKVQEYVSTIAGVALISLFLILAYMGFLKMGDEKTEKYDEYVGMGKAAVDAEEYEDAEEYFEDAISYDDSRLWAYYEKLLMISEMQQYETAVQYGENILARKKLSKDLEGNPQWNADVEYVIANAYFEMEDYDMAVEHYKEAIAISQTNPSYYRDYAIALARNGEEEEADRILQEAVIYGLDAVDICLAEGELALKRKNYSTAIEKFRRVISDTRDETMLLRAYLLCANAYKSDGDIENEVNVLEEARTRVEAGNINRVLVQLGEAYARWARQEQGQADQYNEKALACYELLTESQMTFQVQMNMASLHQSLGNYDEAQEILETLIDEYPNDYRPYARCAILICEIQGQLDKELRDYAEVESLYEQAAMLYQVSGQSGDTDMQTLEGLMQSLYQGNWLTQ